VAPRPQQGVETQIHMGDNIAGGDDLHVLARVGQGFAAGAEEEQNRIKEKENQKGIEAAEDEVEDEEVAKDGIGAGLVPLTEAEQHQGGGADPDQRARPRRGS